MAMPINHSAQEWATAAPADGRLWRDAYFSLALDGDGYGDPASAACTHPQADCDDDDCWGPGCHPAGVRAHVRSGRFERGRVVRD